MRWAFAGVVAFLLGAIGVSPPEEAWDKGSTGGRASEPSALDRGPRGTKPAPQETEAPSPARPRSSPAARRGPVIAWDHDGTDVRGMPTRLDRTDIAIRGPRAETVDDDDEPPFVQAPIRVGENTADLGEIFSSLPAGPYRVWVRAVNPAGMVSSWTGPLDVTLHGPAAPGKGGGDSGQTAEGAPRSADTASGTEGRLPADKPAPPAGSRPTDAASRSPSGRRAPPPSSSDPRTKPWERRSPGGCALF